MTSYRISRHDASIVECRVFEPDKLSRELPHVIVHSPSGFNCGYSGSGPLDLALSLLVHHLHEDPLRVSSLAHTDKSGQSQALRMHTRFSADIVQNLFLDDGESYNLTSEQIGHWILEGI